MRKLIAVFATIFTVFALMPTEAQAIPRAWRDAPTVTVGANTYRVKGHAAVLVKTRGANVTIPREIRARGRHYEVRNVWDTALRGAKVVTIHARLDGCESARLWAKGVRVRVTDKGMYQWLKRTGANVTLFKCKGCK